MPDEPYVLARMYVLGIVLYQVHIQVSAQDFEPSWRTVFSGAET